MALGKRPIPDQPSIPQPLDDRTEIRTYQLRLATPMFGGGPRAGQADPRMPARPSSIRGHLRFWWRMLYRHTFLKDNQLDVAGMRAREAEIWGHTELPSPIRLLVKTPRLEETNRSKPFRKFSDKDTYGFRSFSPELYALFPAVQEEVPTIVREGYQFELRLAWPTVAELHRLRALENKRRQRARQQPLPGEIPDIGPDIEAALAAWIALSGLGARTRRGLGSLELVESSHPLPPWRLPAGARLFVPERADDDAMQAWMQAVEVYQKFRQSFRGRGTRHPIPGRSHWPEPDSIRALTGCALNQPGRQHSQPVVNQTDPNFPRAVLGLPIGFHFSKDGPGKGSPAKSGKDPADVTLVPCTTDGSGLPEMEPDGQGHQRARTLDRMASPILTRPLLLDGQWRAAVVILPHQHALNVSAVLKGSRARLDPATNGASDLHEVIPNSQIVGPHLSTLYPHSPGNPLAGHSNAIDALIDFLGQRQGGADPPKTKTVFAERFAP